MSLTKEEERAINKIMNLDNVHRFFGEDFQLQPQGQETKEECQIKRLIDLVKSLFKKMKCEQEKNTKLQRVCSRLAKKLIGMDQLSEPELNLVLSSGITLYSEMPLRRSLSSENTEMDTMIKGALGSEYNQPGAFGDCPSAKKCENKAVQTKVPVNYGIEDDIYDATVELYTPSEKSDLPDKEQPSLKIVYTHDPFFQRTYRVLPNNKIYEGLFKDIPQFDNGKIIPLNVTKKALESLRRLDSVYAAKVLPPTPDVEPTRDPRISQLLHEAASSSYLGESEAVRRRAITAYSLQPEIAEVAIMDKSGVSVSPYVPTASPSTMASGTEKVKSDSVVYFPSTFRTSEAQGTKVESEADFDVSPYVGGDLDRYDTRARYSNFVPVREDRNNGNANEL